MALCQDNKNPLQHAGTSQGQRMPAALQDGYVQVDERSDADAIVYAVAYAKLLNYFNASNQPDGDWGPFFSSDVSAVLANVAAESITGYQQQVKQLFTFLKNKANEPNEAALKEKLTTLFALVFTLSKALDDYYAKLPDTVAIKSNLLNLVSTKLAPALPRLIAYYNGAKAEGLIAGITNGSMVFKLPLVSPDEWMAQGLSKIWIGNYTDWPAFISDIAADSSIYEVAAGTVFQRISHAANHNLFSGIFDQYLMVLARVIQLSAADLQKTLTNWDTHTPHYALFLSFLQLMNIAKKEMNTLTRRHLDFYYKQVLRLQPRPAEPNAANVLIELAKQVDSYALPAGTLVKGGKDSSGKEVLYAFDKETVFNKAAVVSLRSFYKAGTADVLYNPDTKAPVQSLAGRLFASPIANSADGLGAAITSASKEWSPFVNKLYQGGLPVAVAMPPAEIGFAIASHYLYLQEGERKVYIRLALNNNAALGGIVWNGAVTTEKGWLAIDEIDVLVDNDLTFSDGITPCVQLSFFIPANKPATANYNAAIHGGNFTASTPIVKLTLPPDSTAYDALKNLTVSKVEIRVEVGMKDAAAPGIKNIMLSNDFGPLDASKPFQPFGAQPTAGSSLVIGSREIFTKKHVSVGLHLQWKALDRSVNDLAFGTQPDGGQRPNIRVDALSGGAWQTVTAQDELFEVSGAGLAPDKTLSISGSPVDNAIVSFNDNYLPYSAMSKAGFAAIQLTEGFGHKAYLDAYTTYLINKANKVPDKDNPKPVEPYTPVIQSIKASYSAYSIEDISSVSEAGYSNRSLHLFSVYPFGAVEQHRFANQHIAQYLLPQFSYSNKEDNTTTNDIGELYIGIANLQTLQTVSLLFQVLEGSTNPLLTKPDHHVQWSCLSNNNWIAFADREVSDGTLQLLQSGIIAFTIPANATVSNTLLPAGLLWLRASIGVAADAVCQVISIDAQAATVHFLPNGNVASFLDTPLAQGSITKLKAPDAAVKKIEQPYTAFGGRPAETETQFYTRASERLRHKARAITIWDYEHLVLDAFPEIYKVKCLNHTRVEGKANVTEETNEVKPGYVTIITIPKLLHQSNANPLKPYTNQNTLVKIEQFLQKKISCHVSVKAHQPLFEEVRLQLEMKLISPYTDFSFYANQLNEEIKQYLSPWAYNTDADVSFGASLYKSSLINFIEERYYVDYITQVKMFVTAGATESSDSEEITASTARSILVSASNHTITEATDESKLAAQECMEMKV